MIYKINCEHIYFDRYAMSEEEKLKEAKYILNKAFKDDAYIDGANIQIDNNSLEDEMRIRDIAAILRREFFILTDEIKEEKSIQVESLGEKAEKYIRQNYLYEGLTPLEICEHCGTVRGVLDREFKKMYGKSVSEYIRHIRCEKAKTLIGSGERMDVVASLCGFGSVKSMQRAFKAVFGKTPGEFRY